MENLLERSKFRTKRYTKDENMLDLTEDEK